MASPHHISLPDTHAATPPWTPETDAQRADVRAQLDRILASPLFVNSKRSAVLLKFVAEYVLDGKTEHLKERSLGLEVFQREPDYDTNRDPVVRTTAVEIRKRLAQYYLIPEHDREIRISFPAGSYVLEFRLPPDWIPPPQGVPEADPSLQETVPAPRHRFPRLWLLPDF